MECPQRRRQHDVRPHHHPSRGGAATAAAGVEQQVHGGRGQVVVGDLVQRERGERDSCIVKQGGDSA